MAYVQQISLGCDIGENLDHGFSERSSGPGGLMGREPGLLKALGEFECIKSRFVHTNEYRDVRRLENDANWLIPIQFDSTTLWLPGLPRCHHGQGD